MVGQIPPDKLDIPVRISAMRLLKAGVCTWQPKAFAADRRPDLDEQGHALDVTTIQGRSNHELRLHPNFDRRTK
jgi:hypothetical protein